MLDLYIKHGRRTKDEELDDWGPNGPRLKGCVGIHETYRNGANVFFATQADAEEARRLTGWEWFDDKALSMRLDEEFVSVTHPDGTTMLYGDWGVIASEP